MALCGDLAVAPCVLGRMAFVYFCKELTMSVKLFRQTAVLFGTLLLSAAALAAPPSEKSIDELIAVSRMQEQLSIMFKSMENDFVLRMAKSQQEREKIVQIQKGIVQIMQEEMSWNKISPIYKKIYRDTFTQEEVNQLIAFYKSPGGQALLKKMPMVVQQAQQQTQEKILPQVMQRVQQLIQEVRAESAAQGKTGNRRRAQ